MFLLHVTGIKKETESFKKSCCERKLEMCPLLLGLVNGGGYKQVSSLIGNHLEDLRNTY
jgi:hypothetical protein